MAGFAGSKAGAQVTTDDFPHFGGPEVERLTGLPAGWAGARYSTEAARGSKNPPPRASDACWVGRSDKDVYVKFDAEEGKLEVTFGGHDSFEIPVDDVDKTSVVVKAGNGKPVTHPVRSADTALVVIESTMKHLDSFKVPSLDVTIPPKKPVTIPLAGSQAALDRLATCLAAIAGAPTASKRTVTVRERFVYSTGEFMRESGGAWIELRHQGPSSSFREVGRTPTEIELFDQDRAMWVRLLDDRAEWRSAAKPSWGVWPGSGGSWR